ncbi:hypothetical protein O9993_17580 [Vibrio lentus]|nr:hypothetical protein [Vibrio lentus]
MLRFSRPSLSSAILVVLNRSLESQLGLGFWWCRAVGLSRSLLYRDRCMLAGFDDTWIEWLLIGRHQGQKMTVSLC